jgi:ABC-type uncharacterized transport system permease subunit
LDLLIKIFDLTLLSSTFRMVAPILLAALGGAICARAGLFNVGLEGFIIIGAFAAVTGNYLTGNLIWAVVFAVISVMIYSLLFAYLSIHLQANVIVVGIAVNFLAFGLTTFGLRTIFDVKGVFYDPEMSGLPRWDIPLLQDVPWLGTMLSGHTPLVYLTFLLVIILHIYLFKTVSGFRMNAVGENLPAAVTIGIRVRAYQYGAVLLCGALCGLAGAQLSLGQVTLFSEGMTAGRGFIALVAMMLGQSFPLWVMAASFFFGLMYAVGIRLQGVGLPTQFTDMIPYVVTIIAMFFFANRKLRRGLRTADKSEALTAPNEQK